MGSIQIKNVNKWFGKNHVLKDINLDIADGEFVIFVGPSGCGKSTLLRVIAGLEDITDGEIIIDGVDVSNFPPSERKLSMVFQSYALYPHMNVKENMAFGLKIAKTPKNIIEEKVNNAARILKLDEYLQRKPKDLSGGQRQRVAIGRAIVREPKGFLFDEPLSNLDAALRVDMRLEIAKLHRSLSATMIYVTHDQVEAMTLADKIVILQAGLIEQVGKPDILYQKPDNLFVAQFIGSPKMNIIPCTVKDGVFKISGGSGDKAPVKSDNATINNLGIRPEHISVVDGKGHCQGVAEVSEYLGADRFMYVSVKDVGMVTVRMEGTDPDYTGKKINLKFSLKNLHFFDESGLRVN